MRKSPLRIPVQSLIEFKEQLVNDQLLDYVLFPLIALLWALHEWLRHWFGFAPQHIAASILTVIASVISVIGIIKYRKQLMRVNCRIQGENSVGQYLEQFRAYGYQVFHDVPGVRIKGKILNIDHVLIGPGGVFAIETKYQKKPTSGHCIVESDGSSVLINGVLPKPDPIKQALAQRNCLRSLLVKSTGQAFPVQPVVVYPGWLVQNKSPISTVQVLNEKMIQRLLNTSTIVLQEDQIHMAAYHLSRHIISTSKRAA